MSKGWTLSNVTFAGMLLQEMYGFCWTPTRSNVPASQPASSCPVLSLSLSTTCSDPPPDLHIHPDWHRSPAPLGPARFGSASPRKSGPLAPESLISPERAGPCTPGRDGTVQGEEVDPRGREWRAIVLVAVAAEMVAVKSTTI